MHKKLLLAPLISLLWALVFAAGAAAQEVEVDRYQITARLDPAASTVDCHAAITIVNLGQSPKNKFYFRLAKLAKVTAATVNNGEPAQFEVSDDKRVAALSQVVVSTTAAVAPNATAKIEIAYRIEAPESSNLVHIYPGEMLLAPESIWVPMPSTVFTPYGPATAPFTLDVSAASTSSGFRVVSAGTLKSAGPAFSFDQPLNSVPFIIAGNYDQPVATEHGGVQIEVYVQPGLTAATDLKPGAAAMIKRLADEAGRAVDFLTRTLGPPPAGATFRIISSARTNNLTVPGALVLNEQVFRRDRLTESTIDAVADAVARIWIEGRVRLRGIEARSGQRPRSVAFLRDSLPRYLAALYFEDRFGREAGRSGFEQMRWNYTPVAQSGRDAELGLQTIALANYTPAIFSKGPLVLRMMAEAAGRDKFLAAIKAVFAVGQNKIVNPDDFRAAAVKAGGPDVEKIFQQWLDTIIEPDLIVGSPLPSEKPNSQPINLRNLGTGDVTVKLLAVTASGKQLTMTVTVPSENITTVEIPTGEKIASVEVDPDKLLIQSNYDNDARSGDMKLPRPGAQTLFNQSIAAFNKADYAEAETKLREAVRADPTNALIRAWLGRVLAAEKKFDEASSEANAAAAIEPPVGSALAWAHVTLGQAAMARSQGGEAVAALRRAVVEAEEAPAQFAARELLIQAERAANQLPTVDQSIRSYITQLDSVIKDPTSDRLTPLIVRNNLKRFIQGLTTTRPTAWTTEILRVDPLDANRAAVDVALTAKAGNRDQSGTAVYILNRAGGSWVLEDVQLFNVK